MSVEVSNFIDVRERLDRLGCRKPDNFAVLPLNFETAGSIGDFRVASESATIKTLLRSEDVAYDEIVADEDRPPYIQNNAFEWMVPVIFIPAALMSENPNAVSVALSVIANYATDFMKGVVGDKHTKFEAVVELPDGTCKKVTYSGPPEGLGEVASIIKEVSDNE